MRVVNRIIFDIMLNIIIVVVIFIISTIKEQLPLSPSCGKLLPHRFPLCSNLQQGQVRAAARAWGSGGGGGYGGVVGGGGPGPESI